MTQDELIDSIDKLLKQNYGANAVKMLAESLRAEAEELRAALAAAESREAALRAWLERRRDLIQHNLLIGAASKPDEANARLQFVFEVLSRLAGPTPAEPTQKSSDLGRLDALLKEAGVVVKFGLRQQGHMPTVAMMLDAGRSWDDIGKAIGWSGDGVRRMWEIESAPPNAGPTPEGGSRT